MGGTLPREVSIVVPAFNEALRIESTVREIREYFDRRRMTHEIIVSADGGDGTREKVRNLTVSMSDLFVIGQNERRGKGRGVREAVRLTRGRIVGFVDADQKTPIAEFDKIDAQLKRGYDVVIGSRALRDSAIEQRQPLHRRIGSRGFSVFMHTVVGLRSIPDTQCGFKFFRRDVAFDLFARQRIDGYMFDVEILYLAARTGYRIAQVPVRWRDDGDSRLQLVAGNLKNLADVFRIRFSAYPSASPVVPGDIAESREIVG